MCLRPKKESGSNRFKYVLFESESDFIDSKETVSLAAHVFSDVYELN